tara:strand:+ start:687 stop:1037 length:351 start_codon:yes stop_codon:yes gene_type:complete
MEHNSTLIMENKKSKDKNEQEVTHIELIWDSTDELDDLYNSPEFVSFILKKSYSSITNAIENNLDKVELFNIFNVSVIIELNKDNYIPVLNKIVNYFISIEDYEECEKIKKLINKI